MSGCSSDSEEFYDAEDNTPIRNHRRSKEHSHGSTHLGDGSVRKKRIPPPILKPESPIPLVEEEQILAFPLPIVPILITEHKEDHEILQEDKQSEVSDDVSNAVELDKKIMEIEKRSKRLEDLRKRMQTEEDQEGAPLSPSDSQSSSVDGIHAASKTSYPFRIIEHDTLSLQSTISLGRVGRILGGTAAADVVNKDQLKNKDKILSTSSQDVAAAVVSVSESATSDSAFADGSVVSEDHVSNEVFQEPDVVASTKSSTSSLTGTKSRDAKELKVPVAPPRKKKKKEKRKLSSAGSDVSTIAEELNIASTAYPVASVGSTSSSNNSARSRSSETDPVPQLPSPASTIESLTREFEHSLDIRMATKGQYVVKPQDEDRTKAEGPPIPNQLSLSKSDSFTKEASPGSASGDSSHSNAGLPLDNPTPMPLFVTKLPGSKKASPSGSMNRYPDTHSLVSIDSTDFEGIMKTVNMMVRTRTDSGKELSDIEILDQVTVLNLDTGERIPLSTAEDKLPTCINPLSLHIMRLTSEYVSNSSLEKDKESDDESVDLNCKKSSAPGSEDGDNSVVKKKTAQFKKFLGHTMKKTMDKAKSIAQEVSHARHKDEGHDITESSPNSEQFIKLKASSSHKGPYDFDTLQFIQDLSKEHSGPIWCMKFSACGRLLATAGQDRVLRIWVLKDAYNYFQDMRTKYNAEKVSPTPSQESLVSQQSSDDALAHSLSEHGDQGDLNVAFITKPFCTYSGHTSDLLDVSWSKNYFILSSSMDKTVRLWHISRKECLCCFQHIDFVTAIAFHPRDDRYFLSGSLDGKLRLWNIPDKKVALWNELDGQTKLITAANFCQNGKFAVVGSYDGRCIFYNTEQLKYYTQIHVRSTRGKNSKGRKISGIEPMPGEDKVLVTSNDSRIRLYDLRDLNLSCKYKGCVNLSSQIRACFSHDGKYIISGSENQCTYIWRTHHDYAKFSSARRDRNDYWEGIKSHNAVVTCAIFAPNPDLIIKQVVERERLKTEDPLLPPQTSGCSGYVIVSADFNGCIKVFLNKVKPKHSSLPASALA